jgi:hypothetical protein
MPGATARETAQLESLHCCGALYGMYTAQSEADQGGTELTARSQGKEPKIVLLCPTAYDDYVHSQVHCLSFCIFYYHNGAFSCHTHFWRQCIVCFAYVGRWHSLKRQPWKPRALAVEPSCYAA